MRTSSASIFLASLLAHSANSFSSGLHATTLARARARVLRPMTLSMQQQQTTLAGGTKDWKQAVGAAQARAAAVKSDQDATTSAMAVGAAGFFNLPLTDNVVADVLLSILVGVGFGYLAGFDTSPAGGAVRSLGSATGTAVATVDGALGISEKVQAAAPEGGFSYANIKKYGVAGTLAYVITELAFWAVAFPVASTTFYNTAGHWPDFGDGSDRTAVLAFIFAGANVARLVVPLRFAAAFAIVPWVDENIVQQFGIGGGDSDGEK